MTENVLALRLRPDVIAASRGDQLAFGRLVDITRNVVTSITFAILRDRDASADVAQEVYLAVWTDLKKVRDPSSFLPWIRQLARNRANHSLRTELRFRKRVTRDLEDTLLAAASDPRPGAIDEIVAEEERSALRRAIDQLPENAREVVVLYYREGRSVAQVADLLGMSENAVKQRLSRSRSQLRESLAENISASGPIAAFTAAVLSAITLAAPSTAAALAISASKAAGGKAAAKLTGTGALLSALSGVAMGFGSSTVAIIYSARKSMRAARDEEEKRGIVQMSVATFLAMLGFLTVILLWPAPLNVTIAFAVMIVVFCYSHLVWLPRIISRRYAAELLEDPVGAARRHAHEKRISYWGCTAGVLLGGATVLASWFF